MFTLIAFIIKLFMLGFGALLVAAGVKNWRWVPKMIFGKKAMSDMGETLPKIVMIVFGAILAILALIWIF